MTETEPAVDTKLALRESMMSYLGEAIRVQVLETCKTKVDAYLQKVVDICHEAKPLLSVLDDKEIVDLALEAKPGGDHVRSILKRLGLEGRLLDQRASQGMWTVRMFFLIAESVKNIRWSNLMEIREGLDTPEKVIENIEGVVETFSRQIFKDQEEKGSIFDFWLFQALKIGSIDEFKKQFSDGVMRFKGRMEALFLHLTVDKKAEIGERVKSSRMKITIFHQSVFEQDQSEWPEALLEVFRSVDDEDKAAFVARMAVEEPGIRNFAIVELVDPRGEKIQGKEFVEAFDSLMVAMDLETIYFGGGPRGASPRHYDYGIPIPGGDKGSPFAPVIATSLPQAIRDEEAKLWTPKSFIQWVSGVCYPSLPRERILSASQLGAHATTIMAENVGNMLMSWHIDLMRPDLAQGDAEDQAQYHAVIGKDNVKPQSILGRAGINRVNTASGLGLLYFLLMGTKLIAEGNIADIEIETYGELEFDFSLAMHGRVLGELSSVS